jgi:hypothetical protein
MMKLVVRSQSWQRAHPHAVSEEDLCGSVDPGPALQELVPVDAHVEGQTVHGPVQGQRAGQQDEHDKVRKERREPNDLEGINKV